MRKLDNFHNEKFVLEKNTACIRFLVKLGSFFQTLDASLRLSSCLDQSCRVFQNVILVS